jgi:HAMP domain-containing protein
MAGLNSSISAKTTLKVNIVLLMFLVAGGFGISYYQQIHFDSLITLEEKAIEEQMLRRGEIFSQVGAKAVGQIIEEAIDNTTLSVTDFFDTEYQEIPGFDPPKYHSKVDSYLDKAILAVEDEFLKDPDIVFAVAVDINGYLPTHNTKYQQPPTGDKEKDKAGNRTKRIFNDPVGIKAAKNTEKVLRQVYNRDTGETMWDMTSPIMVKGKQWGSFRIGLSMTNIQKVNEDFGKQTDRVRSNFRNTLLMVMGAILVVSLLAVFLTIATALNPLKKLTVAANSLADGKLEEPVVKESSDELGQLADVLERLRLSLNKSMEKLRKR